jgi:DNA-binding transcriptional LysR family regulator
MPSSFGRLMILPVLLRICAEHPELQLTMTFTDHFVDPVEEGIDLLIRFGGLDQAQHLVARRLGTQQLITCASPAYLDRHGTPATVDDLHAHRSIVGYRYGQPVAWRIGEDAGQARFIPSGTHQLNDGDAVIEAAIAGLGICQMPHFLVKRHLQTGALQQVLGHCMQHHVEIHALWPQTRHLRPKVRYVVDALATLADAGAFD